MMSEVQKTFLSNTKSLERLCIHTITTKPWPIERAMEEYSKRGIGGISIWRDAIEGRDLSKLAQQLKEYQLTPVALVRGGFLASVEAKQYQAAIEENKKAIDEAHTLGCDQVVLVCGADPRQSINENIQQIIQGIQEVLPYAKEKGVRLSIEPLHPMYADTRSAVSTLKTANDMCDVINDDHVGIALDVFHVWWDPELKSQMERMAAGKKFYAFHLCDWKVNMGDMLNDRGMMGEGVIPLKRICEEVAACGFDGFHEVEIFSNSWWSKDQAEFLDKIVQSYLELC